MDEIFYKGKKYIRTGKKWTTEDNMVVPEALQINLNLFFLRNLDLEACDCKMLIDFGDKCKASASNSLAIRFYEKAVEKGTKRDLMYILPRITSCYRTLGHFEEVISILKYSKEKFGVDIITPALLTSAAAAYCDMQEYDKATKCCNKAYAMCGGKSDAQLTAVYRRIKSETK